MVAATGSRSLGYMVCVLLGLLNSDERGGRRREPPASPQPLTSRALFHGWLGLHLEQALRVSFSIFTEEEE